MIHVFCVVVGLSAATAVVAAVKIANKTNNNDRVFFVYIFMPSKLKLLENMVLKFLMLRIVLVRTG